MKYLTKTVELDVPKDKANAQVLTQEEISDLTKCGIILEQHYENNPQDIEFAIANKKIIILQA